MSKSFREHPDEATVLRFLDGELTEREAAALRSHLDGCWQCRRNLGEWQGTIDAFLRLRETAQFAAEPPPNPWVPFEQLYPAPAAARPGRWWHLLKLAAVAAAIVVAVIAGVRAVREANAPPARPAEAARTAAAEPLATRAPVPAARKTAAAVAPPAKREAEGAAGANPWHSRVMAAQALHELGADLGEPVEMVAAATEATVRARALDPRRRETIREALAKIPGVVFAYSEAAPAESGASNLVAGGAQTPRPKLFAAELEQRLGGAAAVERFANAVLDDSDAIAVRAHALQTLERLFPEQAPLTTEDRAVIAGMAAAHRAVMEERVAALRGRLAPFLAGAGGGTAEPASLAARANELDRLLNAAFAGAQVPLTDAELAGRIQTLLKDLAR